MSSQRTANQRPLRVGEQPWVKWSLISLALFFVAVLLLIPLLSIFQQAFASGLETYITNLSEPDTLHAIGLTLVVALLTVPINLVFGVMLAWSVTRFEFTGRKFLTTLIIVLVTVFVTCPFVARELIPLMQQQGRSDEEAAVILGASWWQLFRRVTLPNIKWALIYGVILTNARAYEDYQSEAAFASASLLAFIALLTLILKAFVEWRQERNHVIKQEQQGTL